MVVAASSSFGSGSGVFSGSLGFRKSKKKRLVFVFVAPVVVDKVLDGTAPGTKAEDNENLDAANARKQPRNALNDRCCIILTQWGKNRPKETLRAVY